MKGLINILFITILFVTNNTYSQIVINEICILNDDAIVDEDGDKSDWIELYNNSNQTINLEGYKLISKLQNKSFTLGTSVLNPNQFLLLFLSSKNKTSINIHTNFKAILNDTIQLIDINNQLLSQIVCIDTKVDDSYGMKPDGSNHFYILTNPTPQTSNNTSNNYHSYSAAPIVNLQPGFYKSSQILTISNYDNDAINYYTTDGSIPNTNSAIYTAPITINNSTTFKIFSKSDDKPSSKIYNYSYFIAEDIQLPTISIIIDSLLLFDKHTGLLMLGSNTDSIAPYFNGANFWSDTQVVASIQLFDKNKNLMLNQDCELQLHGGSMNRIQAMKSFRILAKKKYEKDRFNYQFISDKPINAYRKIVLRNGSSDFLKAQIRDGLIHKVLIKNTENDAVGYEPYAVFINGKFYGIQDAREKIDEYYLEENHKINRDNLDFLVEENIVELGSFEAFDSIFQFSQNNDLSDSSNFNIISKKIDLFNFADYFISQTYFDNNDWPNNNLRLWRERKNDSKFRYIIFDLDASLGGFSWSPPTLNMLDASLNYFTTDLPIKHCLLLKKILENKPYKKYFINRYADLFNTAFSPSYMQQTIDTVVKKLEYDMPKHFARWGGNINSWKYEINESIIPYIEQRNQLSKQDVLNVFGLHAMHNIEVNVEPKEASSNIQLNTINIHNFPFNGTYYESVAISLTAIPNQGYKFSHWQIINTENAVSTSTTLVRELTSSEQTTAFFYKEVDEKKLQINPNPVTNNHLSISFYCENNYKTTIKIYDMRGNLVLQHEPESFIGRNVVALNTDNLSNGTYNISINTYNETRNCKVIILRNQ